MSQNLILIIEDEPSIAENIQYALGTDGFRSHWCATAEEGRSAVKELGPDLILLDIGLPDQNGFEVARTLRQELDIPIIFVTARDDEIDRVAGLELGADDYVVKPFSPRELCARIRSVLRRTQGHTARVNESPVSGNEDFNVDHDRQIIRLDGTVLDLSRYEYKMLLVFLSCPGKVFSREQLMDRVWDSPEMSLERTVDTHIKNLRRKCKRIRPGVELIRTHRGAGYSLKE